MSHLLLVRRHDDRGAGPSWSALAVVGLLSGLITTSPGATATPEPTPAPPTSTSVTPSVATTPPATPTPTATTTPQPTSPLTVQRPRRHVERNHARPPTKTSEPTVIAEETSRIDAAWMSYLPGPEAGLKIFAAGLLALAISIAGLAALAIRRRRY
jgi:hypothetical protein